MEKEIRVLEKHIDELTEANHKQEADKDKLKQRISAAQATFKALKHEGERIRLDWIRREEDMKKSVETLFFQST